MSVSVSSDRIRVLTVDDHPIMREGIASIVRREPDMEMAGEAENGARGIDVFRQVKPDVTLMDIQMPLLSGVEAIMAIRAEFPNARIIALTTYKGDVQAQRALKAGAASYLLKSTLGPSLIDTIRLVHAGRRHIPADVAQEIALHAADPALSSRELSVLTLAARGQSNKEIANALDVSEDTIKAHMKSLFLKLNVNDRTGAVTSAHKRGMIEL